MKALRRPPKRLPSSSQCRFASTKHASPTNRHHTIAELSDLRASIRTRVRSARIARREDWMLGPLAPRRDAGRDDYGCVSVRELQGVKGTRGNGREDLSNPGLMGGRKKDAGGGMKWTESLVYVGDRVVVVADRGPESRERGKIGMVTEVRRKEREVVIEDMNLVDIKSPAYLLVTEPNSPPIRTVPLPIPLSSIRLVYPVEANGITEDRIIERLIRIPGRRGRFIANSDIAVGGFIEIPMPEGYAKEPPEQKTHDVDTLRFEVEEETWTPTLLRAPMPGGVIDELRNKYGKHRTRHEEGYLLAMQNRKKRKAEWQAWAKSGGGMLMTPAKEARQKERAEMAAKGKPELKREMLEKIGEVMAAKGIVLTAERQRELERNLMTEDVLVKERAEVLARRKVEKEAAEGVLEEEGDGELFADGELEEEMKRLRVDELRVEEVDESPRRSPV